MGAEEFFDLGPRQEQEQEHEPGPTRRLSEEEKDMAYDQIRKAYNFPFHLRGYQVDKFEYHAAQDLAGFYWEAGCVDADTEYLTKSGWRKISGYTGGLVAQFKPATGEVDFVEPVRYIQAPSGLMVRVKTRRGVDQMLSPEHRTLLYRGDRPHKTATVSAAELYAAYESFKRGGSATVGGIPINHAAVATTFKSPAGDGLPLTQAQLRLQVAAIADGHFGASTNRCVIRLKKPRKIARLRELLSAAGVVYAERGQDTRTSQGFTVFTFNAPLRLKELGGQFWAADEAQMEAIADEVSRWDGSEARGSRGRRFSSTSKESADFVQYVWSRRGRACCVREDTRAGKYRGGVCYEVIESGPSRTSLKHLVSKGASTMSLESSRDGRKYCFEVPSGYLLLRRNGCIFATGNSGKTAGATHWALYRSLLGHADQWVALMPPILLDQWARWLRSVRCAETGTPLDVTIYRGTPAQRKKANLEADFVLMSYQVFKNDYERIYGHFQGKEVGLLADEAHAVKNIESQTHKAVKDFSEGRPLGLLTGTPITHPGDSYAYLRLMAPGVYRNKRHFEMLHVKERGEYERVLEWQNLDLLAQNMKVNSSRILRREVRDDLPPLIITPITYSLAPEHIKLYHRLAEERLVELDDDAEIDAISQQELRSAMQQIILNWGDYAQDEKLKPAAIDLVEAVLDEIGDAKLVVVANFIRSNRSLLKWLKPYNAVAIYGETTDKQRAQAIDRFMNDASCRVMQIQPQSAGFGLDGLQKVCSEMIFLEAPTTAPPFHQTAARLDRDGQVSPVNCRVAIAQGTVQVRMFRDLLNNDATANRVQGGYKDLRESIFGH